MAKDSLESGTHKHLEWVIANYIPKTEAPGSRVIVSFPAFIKSLQEECAEILKVHGPNLRINLILVWIGSHSKNSILTLQPHFDVRV